MFNVVIVPNNTDANLSLTYKTREAAEAVYEEITGDQDVPAIRIEDDYGYKVSISVHAVSYILFVDIEHAQHVEFDKNMAVNKARLEIEKKLQGMGFKQAAQPSPNGPRRSPIIQS